MAREWTVDSIEELDQFLRDVRRTARDFLRGGKGRTIRLRAAPHLDPVRDDAGTVVDAVCYGMDATITASLHQRGRRP